jgi:peptidoglycan/xylan/chitin deacetylase (PgdA/CDA1 family)
MSVNTNTNGTIVVSSRCPFAINSQSEEVPNAHFASDDVVLLKGYGMTIGSHTWSHRNLALCDRQSVVRELVQSKTHIEAMLGSNVDLLALPGGFAPKGIARYASEAGYSHVFTSQPGYWDGVSYLVPRVCIRSTLAPAELRKLLTGQRSAYLIHEQVKYHMRTLVGPRTFLAAYDVWQRWHGGTVQ